MSIIIIKVRCIQEYIYLTTEENQDALDPLSYDGDPNLLFGQAGSRSRTFLQDLSTFLRNLKFSIF